MQSGANSVLVRKPRNVLQIVEILPQQRFLNQLRTMIGMADGPNVNLDLSVLVNGAMQFAHGERTVRQMVLDCRPRSETPRQLVLIDRLRCVVPFDESPVRDVPELLRQLVIVTIRW